MMRLALLAGLLLAGCGGAAQEEITRDEAIEIARDATREIPGFNLAMTHPVVQEREAAWIVRFEPPDGISGGAAQVEIDKRTRRVVSAMAEQ